NVSDSCLITPLVLPKLHSPTPPAHDITVVSETEATRRDLATSRVHESNDSNDLSHYYINPLTSVPHLRAPRVAEHTAVVVDSSGCYSIRAAFPASSIHFQAHRAPFARAPFAVRPPSSAVYLLVVVLLANVSFSGYP
ncbi:hypothetical protein EYR40_002664, partial [Pleurotus pulmonarius]